MFILLFQDDNSMPKKCLWQEFNGLKKEQLRQQSDLESTFYHLPVLHSFLALTDH